MKLFLEITNLEIHYKITCNINSTLRQNLKFSTSLHLQAIKTLNFYNSNRDT